VSGSNAQCSRCHSEEEQDLRQIEDVVQCRYRADKELGQKGKQQETELGQGSQGEARTAKVHFRMPEENVERVLAKPEGG
jgi:hypothetical protein